MVDLTQIFLRTASDSDRSFAFEVKKAAMRPYIEPIWGWDEIFQVEFHRNDWVVRNESGFHLGEFYLFPAYQRQGIGLHLMKTLLRDADAAKLPVLLEVIKINPVQSLYRRCDFEISGETKTHYLMERAPKQSR